MSTQYPTTPVTDDEQWSDETEASPQHAGYTPLDQYQALGEGEDGDDRGGDQSDHEAGNAEETWREAAEDGGRRFQHDVRGREH